MSARRHGPVALLLIVVGLLLPTSALAGETFSFPGGSVTYARLKATHGYRVNLSENDKGYFSVRVVGHGTTTGFGTRAKQASGDRLVADFGRRGRFDLRFVPVGRPEAVPTGGPCTGKDGSWQGGRLVGTGRFRTERGYARIDIHHVLAAAESWSRQTCDLEKLEGLLFGHPKVKRSTLAAVATEKAPGAKRAKRTLSFRMTQYYRHARPADERVSFVVELKEPEGRISIIREVKVTTKERSLVFPGLPQLPEQLEVKPPLPFEGTAELRRTHESTYDWGGDLAVTFPGLDPIRLAGPRFSVALCASTGCVLRQEEASSASATLSRALARSTPMLSR